MTESMPAGEGAMARILASYSMDAERSPEWLRTELKRLADTAATALAATGVEVRFVDAGRSEEDPGELVAGVDGVLVLGGADIDPALYGQQPESGKLYGVDPRADKFELGLIEAALEGSKPFLGICRGMQLLNVAQGGTLIQHLGDETMHSNDDVNATMIEHEVALRPGTLVGGLYDSPTLGIRSGHHQAVAEVGADLTVTADASDGTIEAIEGREGWVLGVQWHPEDPNAEPQQLATLMSAFAAECARVGANAS